MKTIKLESLSLSMICALVLTSCVNDKILHASLEKTTGGDITADIKEETQALIFQETPIDQHLAVYEDYIKCVESNWNVAQSIKLSDDPWDPRK